jgi:superfamily II DNA or RNA helicase
LLTISKLTAIVCAVNNYFNKEYHLFELRPFQADADADLTAAYAAGHKVVMIVLPTGSGKTILFTHRIATFPGISLAMAHRAELVTQMSLTLARAGILHRIIGPQTLVKRCAKIHMLELGAQFISSNANVICASVQTLDGKNFAMLYPVYANLLNQVGQWICDEGHHLLEHNMWGRVVAKMPNAIGLVPTATPERADGKGLGRDYDGVVDHMVVGPTQRELIDWGFLTDYKIFSPDPCIDLGDVEISAQTGDFNKTQLIAAGRKQKKKIVGDLVAHYFKFAPHKLTICFVTDLETADDVCKGFVVAGIPAAVVSSKTDPLMRAQIMREFAQRKYLVLVNVDILGEGVDVPAVECVIMGRPTASFSLFNQQCGRPLRLAKGKEWAIIIDAVGNVQRHARAVEYPDGRVLIDLSRSSWSLASREKRGSSKAPDPDKIPMSRCSACTRSYSGLVYICPHCNHDNSPDPANRTLENVDGDLTLLTAEELAALQNVRIERLATFAKAAGQLAHSNPSASMAQHKNASKLKASGTQLDNAIRFFGGFYEAHGDSRSSIYRRFAHRYGIDVMSAQGLSAKDSDALTARICEDLANRQLTR